MVKTEPAQCQLGGRIVWVHGWNFLSWGQTFPIIAALAIFCFSSGAVATSFGRPFPVITSDFGPRDLGGAAGSYFHRGTDFSAHFGTTLPAVEAGKIFTISYQQGGAGLYIWAKSSTEDRTVEYMHLFEDEGLPALALDKEYSVTDPAARFVKVTRMMVNGSSVYVIIFLDANHLPVKALSSLSGLAVPGSTVTTKNNISSGEVIAITGNTGAGPAHFHLGTFVASKGTPGRYNAMTHVERSGTAAYPLTLAVEAQSGMPGSLLNEKVRVIATATSSSRFDLDGVNFYVADSLVWRARFGGLLGEAEQPADISTMPPTATATGAHAIGGAGTDRFIYNFTLPAGLGNGPVSFKTDAISCRGEVSTASTSFFLTGGAAIGGKVVTASGSPVQGATVTITPGRWILTTAVDGSFSVSNITAGNYSITAAKTGYTVVVPQSVTAQSGVPPASVTFAMKATGGNITGMVKQKSGAPLPGAIVTLAPGSSGNVPAQTAHGSEFIFENMKPGVYSLVAEADNFKKSSRTLTIIEGQSKSVSFSLTPIPPPSIVATVRKTSADGSTVFAQRVIVSITGPLAKTARTGWGETAGKAKFYDLPAGTYSVSYRSSNGSATVVAGQTVYVDLGP